MFQSEQVWYEYKEWHDICYNALRSKINSLDISINKLKIKDENEIKVSLVLQTKHVEKLHEIVNALFKSYGHEENKQNEQYADQFNKKSIVTMFDLETIKKIKERSQAIKDKNAIHHFSPKVKDAACYASYPLKVLTPYSSKDARGLLKVSITDPNPNILLENDLLHDKSFFVSDEVLYSNFHLPTGKAKIEKVGMGVTTKPFSKIGGHAFKVERFGVASRVVSHQVQWSQAIVGEVGAQVQWSQAIVGEVGAQVQWSQAIVGETTRGATSLGSCWALGVGFESWTRKDCKDKCNGSNILWACKK
ncbi:hypothetical protein V6N13_008087 [Hibiscus sabdariffa]